MTVVPSVRSGQILHRFDNGYGASVVSHDFSYGGNDGLSELAVIRWRGKNDFDLTYETPITDDVIGWLDDDAVEELVKKIEALRPEDIQLAKARKALVSARDAVTDALATLDRQTNREENS